jgi:hypothetical protein
MVRLTLKANNPVTTAVHIQTPTHVTHRVMNATQDGAVPEINICQSHEPRHTMALTSTVAH